MTIRRQFIVDCVEHYIREYPDEYVSVLRNIEEQRKKIADKKYAKIQNAKGIRLGFRIPDRLLNMIQVGLDGQEAKRLFEVKGEDIWFGKKYSQFLIPSVY